MNADYSCKINGCPYFVDWIDYPNTTGYSMARSGGKYSSSWFGCERVVAIINHMDREHRCIKEELTEAARERQLELI